MEESPEKIMMAFLCIIIEGEAESLK